jgi:hypothetical protein
MLDYTKTANIKGVSIWYAKCLYLDYVDEFKTYWKWFIKYQTSLIIIKNLIVNFLFYKIYFMLNLLFIPT